MRGREARVAGGDGAAVLRHDQLPHLRGQAAARADHRQDQLQAVPEGVLGSLDVTTAGGVTQINKSDRETVPMRGLRMV